MWNYTSISYVIEKVNTIFVIVLFSPVEHDKFVFASSNFVSMTNSQSSTKLYKARRSNFRKSHKLVRFDNYNNCCTLHLENLFWNPFQRRKYINCSFDHNDLSVSSNLSHFHAMILICALHWIFLRQTYDKQNSLETFISIPFWHGVS